MLSLIGSGFGLFGITDHDVLAFLTILVVFGIPIIAILTNHQRRMAELMYRQASGEASNPHTSQELQMLRNEVGQLRELVQQQVIRLEAVEGQPLTRAPATNQPVILESSRE